MTKSIFAVLAVAFALGGCGSEAQQAKSDVPLTAEEEAAKAERIRKANAAAESQLGH